MWEPSNNANQLLEIFSVKGYKETRAGFGDAIYDLAHIDNKVVALSADLAHSVKLTKFIQKFPHRFFQCGVAEANMIGVAAGLTIGGYIPFAASFANFVTGRVFDQIRQSVCYSNKNVKICGSHSGLSLGEDGASHQILEDIALMRSLPNMSVLVGADYTQTYKLTFLAYKHNGPVYLRFSRPPTPVFFPDDIEFEFGKAFIMKKGKDVSIFVTGLLTYHAILATAHLEKLNISAELINIHTVKPLDEECIINSVRHTGCAVIVEEHQVNGGLGESIARCIVSYYPVPCEFVAVQNKFGESGKPHELFEKYNLTEANIVSAAQKAISRK